MERIKGGEFDLGDDEWKNVYEKEKYVKKGMIKVEKKKRMRMNDMRRNEWLKGNNVRM
jgi:hypothetical protein